LAHERHETQIAFLKNYSPDRRAVFATEADEIGKIKDKPELHTVLPVSLLQPLVRNGANCEVGCFVSLYHNTNVRQCGIVARMGRRPLLPAFSQRVSKPKKSS
jgi:hypothetical protein